MQRKLYITEEKIALFYIFSYNVIRVINMDRKNLLKILELTEQASEKNIEDSFYMLTRRARNDQTIDLDAVTDAYRKLMHKEKITVEHRKENAKKANTKSTIKTIAFILAFLLIILAFTLYFKYCDYFVFM